MSVAVGDTIGPVAIPVSRASLVRYAGASGDFNPIHWSDSAAEASDLPGVIAHGMFTMGAAIQAVVDWAGDPGAVIDYTVRFSRPVPVPAQGEAILEVTGTVSAIEGAEAQVNLTVVLAPELAGAKPTKVLGKAQVKVRVG
jgi:acyl dehydratase